MLGSAAIGALGESERQREKEKICIFLKYLSSGTDSSLAILCLLAPSKLSTSLQQLADLPLSFL